MPSICAGRGSWAVFIDLDDTLVLTAALAKARAERNWQHVYRQFAQTQMPPGTRAFLTKLSSMAQIGIVTNAPRFYAEKLLAFHRIELPVLIARHDIRQPKPNPEGLIRAARKLQLPGNRCFYIGDSPEDREAAIAAGQTSILVSWSTQVHSEKSSYKMDWGGIGRLIQARINNAVHTSAGLRQDPM